MIELDSTKLSAARFGELFSLSTDEIASLAHVHVSTIVHAPDSERIQIYLHEIQRVIDAALEISPELNKVCFFLKNAPICSFGYRTALTMVSEGKAEPVLQYLHSVASGFVG